MVFKDMNDNSTECVLAVEVKLSATGSSIRWNYPIKYTQVCIFVLALTDSFDEKRAISNNYQCYFMNYPDSQLDINEVANYAIFPVNENGELIRQKKILWTCSIPVTYGYYSEFEKIKAKGLMRFFSKPKIKEHIFLSIKSPINLPGKSILYSVKSKQGVFCIPCDLIANRRHKFEITEPLELFTEEKYISMEKINISAQNTGE